MQDSRRGGDDLCLHEGRVCVCLCGNGKSMDAATAKMPPLSPVTCVLLAVQTGKYGEAI